MSDSAIQKSRRRRRWFYTLQPKDILNKPYFINRFKVFDSWNICVTWYCHKQRRLRLELHSFCKYQEFHTSGVKSGVTYYLSTHKLTHHCKYTSQVLMFVFSLFFLSFSLLHPFSHSICDYNKSPYEQFTFSMRILDNISLCHCHILRSYSYFSFGFSQLMTHFNYVYSFFQN